jgi:hypothetical protein
MQDADVKLLIEQNKLEELYEALSEDKIPLGKFPDLLTYALKTNMGCAKLFLESKWDTKNKPYPLKLVAPIKAALSVGAYGYALRIHSYIECELWKIVVMNLAIEGLYQEAAGQDGGANTKYTIEEVFDHFPDEIKEQSTSFPKDIARRIPTGRLTRQSPPFFNERTSSLEKYLRIFALFVWVVLLYIFCTIGRDFVGI